MSQKPSVGRIVHYVSHGTPVQSDGSQVFPSLCRAAVIAAVDQHPEKNADDQVFVDLVVLNPTGMFFNQTCLLDEGADPETAGDPAMCDGRWHVGGTWHWPARAEDSPSEICTVKEVPGG